MPRGTNRAAQFMSCPRVPASDWAAEMIAGSVTFCDIISFFLCSRWRICQLGAQVETLDRLCLARRASTSPLPEFYNMPMVLIPTAAVVALEESTTHMDSGGGDGWVMSQDYAMHVLSTPATILEVAPSTLHSFIRARRLGPKKRRQA
jgi:hypothetical protein